MKKCLILANGDPPKKSWINYLSKQDYSTLICADGGANSAKKLGVIPDVIIGDFDSISNESIRFFKSKSKIIKVSRQNDTDVEKSIKYAISKSYTKAILLGATGDRLDHTFCNIGILLRYKSKIDISILHGKSFMSIYEKNVELKTTPGEVISIYGIEKGTKIISKGLRYPLKNISLQFGTKESTSNTAIGGKVELKIKNGKIIVVREYEILRKNGFFRDN